MRKSRFQQLLSRQLLSLVFLSACAASGAFAQQQTDTGRPDAAWGYDPSVTSSRYGGAAYDPAVLAAYYNFDPSIVAAATLPYQDQPSMTDAYGSDQVTYEQLTQRGFAGELPQDRLFAPGQNVYQQASYGGSPYSADQQYPPQAVPTLSYNAPGGISVYGRPDPHHGAGGVRFSPEAPPLFRSFETGVYANDDEVLFTLGGVLPIWEGPAGVVAARVLGTAGAFHNGPGKVGVSLDVWGARHFNVLGVNHLFKSGFLWDQQDDLRRLGFTVGGLLFADVAKAPPTFDLAFGWGAGQDFWNGRFREVADFDAQLRCGLLFFGMLRVGGSLQYWQWENPNFEPNETSAGVYAQLDLGQWMVTGDVQSTRERAQGFVNVTWVPGRHAAKPCATTYNVTSQNSFAKYESWQYAAPIRDLTLRTGDPPQPRSRTSRLVGNITAVNCIVRFPGLDTTGDTNTNGFVDPGEGFEIDVEFVNGTNATATGVAFRGVSGGNNAIVTGPATQVGFFGNNPATVPPGGTLRTDTLEDLCLNVDAAAVAGDQIFVTFEVTSNGETARFQCGPFVVGQITNNQTGSAAFQGLVGP